MALTVLEIGEGHFGTRYDPPEGEDPILTASNVTGSEIDFSGTYNGHPITLWFKGSFDLSRVPTGASLFEDYQPITDTASVSSFGFTGYWAVAFDPVATFDKVFELVDAKSDLDFENALSGNDVFRTSAQSGDSDNYFLYAGNDTLYQNHLVQMYDDVYLGGSGIDTLVLPGRFLNYKIEASNSVWDTIHKASILQGYYISDNTKVISTTQINEVERIKFSDTMVGLDVGKGENTGEVYRLYLTVLGRNPESDPVGCGFWIDKLDRDILTAEQMVGNFLNSTEFVSRFGATTSSNDSFVNLMYLNLLGRDGHPDSGFSFWLNVLNNNQASREQVVVGFMESPENISNAAPLIGDTPTYQQWAG